MAEARRITVASAALIAWPGARPALAAALHEALALEMPAPGHWTQARGVVALSLAPDEFELQREGARDLVGELAMVVGAHGGLVGQAGGRAVFRLTGAGLREALAQLLPLDLHPRAFAPDRVAATVGAHMPLLLRQCDASPAYDLACPRSYAGSLQHALSAARIDVA